MKYFYLVTLIILSCSKDNKPLLNGDYKLVSLYYSPPYDYNGDGVKDSECINLQQECDKDDLVRFISETKGEEVNAPIKCRSTDDDTEPFTYHLIDNNTKLVYYKDEFPMYVDTILIQIKNENEFITTQFEIDGNTKYTLKETYRKQ